MELLHPGEGGGHHLVDLVFLLVPLHDPSLARYSLCSYKKIISKGDIISIAWLVVIPTQCPGSMSIFFMDHGVVGAVLHVVYLPSLVPCLTIFS